jgi:hypothetical protein
MIGKAPGACFLHALYHKLFSRHGFGNGFIDCFHHAGNAGFDPLVITRLFLL